jgi:transposase-like protein
VQSLTKSALISTVTRPLMGMGIQRTLCECGCGATTNFDSSGRPRRFMKGHNRRGQGEGWFEQGHWFIQHNGERRALHRVIVEEREGRRLASDEIVHHVDGDPLNNQPENLVILTRAEHIQLHLKRRKRWSKEEQSQALQLYESGMTVDEVALASGRASLWNRCVRRHPEHNAERNRPASGAERITIGLIEVDQSMAGRGSALPWPRTSQNYISRYYF